MLNDSQLSQGFVGRTKILNAVARLVQKTPISKVTVSSICGEAGISRQNFYKYFEDKFDAVIWYNMFVGEGGTNEIGETLTIREALPISLKRFNEDRDFFKAVMVPDPEPRSLFNKIQKISYDHLYRSIKEADEDALTKEMLFKLYFYSHQIPRLYYEWVANKQFEKMSAEEYADYWISLVPTDLREAIDRGTLRARENR